MSHKKAPAANLYWIAAIGLAVVGTLFSLKSNSRTTLLGELSGCYKGAILAGNQRVIIDKNGNFSSRKFKTIVSISEDKEGLYFLPKVKIVINPSDGGFVSSDYGSALKIRINYDKSRFKILDDKLGYIDFIRSTC